MNIAQSTTDACLVELWDGRPCSDRVTEYVLGLPLCRRHHRKLVDEVVRQEELQRQRDWREGQAITERLAKLNRVTPTFKQEPNGGWSFYVGVPAIEGEPRRTIRRRGFRTKREAQVAAKKVLDSLRTPLVQGADEFAAAVKEHQRQAREMLIRERNEAEAARLAAHQSAVAAKRARERDRFVYYVRRPDGAIKIGTTWNLKTRMQAFRNVSPAELLASHSGGQIAEAALHRRFRHLRLDGEWFKPDPDLLAHIEHVIGTSGRRATTLRG